MQSKKLLAYKKYLMWRTHLRCPRCHTDFRADEIICQNGHHYHLAKQGYLNLAPQHHEKHYTKDLFEARHQVMHDGRLYGDLMHDIATHIIKLNPESQTRLSLIDLGTGEGSHLIHLVQALHQHDIAVNSLGIDLAKAGIQTAAKYATDALWCVGDLSNIPLHDSCTDIALAMLSPSHYDETKRILKPGGVCIKVIPGPHYLKELRELVLPADQQRHDSTESRARFEAAFNTLTTFSFTRQVACHPDFMHKLCQMTPLMWHADTQTRQRAEQLPTVTIDLHVMIGKR